MTQTVFYLSDQTGITAELLGQTLLSQFESQTFVTQTIPYVDNSKKADEAVDLINRTAQQNGTRPVLISTIVHDDLKKIAMSCGIEKITLGMLVSDKKIQLFIEVKSF